MLGAIPNLQQGAVSLLTKAWVGFPLEEGDLAQCLRAIADSQGRVPPHPPAGRPILRNRRLG